MRAKAIAAVILLACISGGSETLAQTQFLCEPFDNGTDQLATDVTACSKPMINRQSLANTSSSITHIIMDRLDTGPNQMEPAGLELTNAREIAERLAGNGAILIAPTADVAAPSPTPNWNVWIDGKYSWLDDTLPLSDLDGSLINGVVGADYKVSDRMIFGLMGTYETSDLEGLGVSQDTDGWGGGAYMGLALTDSLVLSATVLGTELDTDVSGGGGAEFDSARLQATGALTGNFYSGTWRYSPSLTVAWSKEWQDASGGFNAQTIETGIISPGLLIGNSVSIGGASTVEPWLGAQLDWVGINKVVDDALGTILDDPYTDLRLQGGFNFAFGANTQLALSAEISGLLYDDSDTYTVGANFAHQF